VNQRFCTRQLAREPAPLLFSQVHEAFIEGFWYESGTNRSRRTGFQAVFAALSKLTMSAFLPS